MAEHRAGMASLGTLAALVVAMLALFVAAETGVAIARLFAQLFARLAGAGL